MNDNELLEKIINILKEYTDKKDVVITKESTLVEDLGLSSLEMIQLVVEFEDNFNVNVKSRDIPSFYKVEDILNYIKEKKYRG